MQIQNQQSPKSAPCNHSIVCLGNVATAYVIFIIDLAQNVFSSDIRDFISKQHSKAGLIASAVVLSFGTAIALLTYIGKRGWAKPMSKIVLLLSIVASITIYSVRPQLQLLSTWQIVLVLVISIITSLLSTYLNKVPSRQILLPLLFIGHVIITVAVLLRPSNSTMTSPEVQPTQLPRATPQTQLPQAIPQSVLPEATPTIEIPTNVPDSALPFSTPISPSLTNVTPTIEIRDVEGQQNNVGPCLSVKENIPRNEPYIVQPGDNMSCIADRAGVLLSVLVKANPHITNPNLIYSGTQLNIP